MLHSLNKGKHTGQTKHDSQNILGCVRLSDLVKINVLINPKAVVKGISNIFVHNSSVFKHDRVKDTNWVSDHTYFCQDYKTQ